jgi:hypothetical protein
VKNLLNHPLRLIAVAAAATLFFIGAQRLFQLDPQTLFLEEVKQMIATVNQGSYRNIESTLSPAFVEMLSDEAGMTARQAILMARKMDLAGSHQYQFVNNPVFHARDYAEVEIDRSGRNGSFESARRFSVPYIWVDGEWKIAGNFRSQSSWNDPF